MLHAGRSLIFDEYIGFLYPLFVRLCYGVQQWFHVGYYLVVYLVQLIGFVAASYYLARAFFARKKAWIVTAFMVASPMCLQVVLMVSTFAFKAIYGLVIIGAMIRLWKGGNEKKTWPVLFVAYILAAFNIPDDLYVWFVPIIIFVFIYIFRHQKQGKWYKKICLLLAIAIAFIVVFGVNKGVIEEGARGRMQKTVSSVLFQRTLWPDFNAKYGFLPEEMQKYIDRSDALASDVSAEKIVCEIGPAVERQVGLEKANQLYKESFLEQLNYNKRSILESVLNDFLGYLLVPFSIVWYLGGQEGSSLGTVYRLANEQNPHLWHIYFCISFMAVFFIVFAAILKYISIKDKAKKKITFLIPVMFIYQALWYAIVNVQGVDYRYSIVNVMMFTLLAVCILEKEDINANDTLLNVKNVGKGLRNGKKKITIFVGTLFLAGCVIAGTVCYFGNYGG